MIIRLAIFALSIALLGSFNPQDALTTQCKYFPDADNFEDQIDDLCHCLEQGQQSGTFSCAKLRHDYETLQAKLAEELINDLIGDLSFAPNEKNLNCINRLSSFYSSWTVEQIQDSCKRGNISLQFINDLELVGNEQPQNCWRMSRVDGDGCVAVRPCLNSGPSDIKVLPVSQEGLFSFLEIQNQRWFAEHEQLRLCMPSLAKLQKRKDEEQIGRRTNLSFLQTLTFGRASPHVTYGPDNCHGLAQDFIGSIISDLSLDRLRFHSDEVERQCGDRARELFYSRVPREQTQTIGAYDHVWSGHIINMDHSASCRGCGRSEMQVFACTADRLEVYSFTEKFCASCWSQRLQQAGWHSLSDNDSWPELLPGCILTTVDHSAVFLWSNDDLCYLYESANPFGPARIRAHDCSVLWQIFPSKYCPKEPLLFPTLERARLSL